LVAEIAPLAPDLAAVLSAWPDLPEPIKAGIVAMVQSVKKPMRNPAISNQR
jgi:N-acetylneuraminic acid mutarotase